MNKHILDRITQIQSEGYHICILKGFKTKEIVSLSKHFALLDKEIIQNNQIHLDKIQGQTLLNGIFSMNNTFALLTYESFLSLCQVFRNISILGKRFAVLTNNLQHYYENPTNASIPDFGDQAYQVAATNQLYDFYYANCFHADNKQWIEYVAPIFEEPEPNVSDLCLIEAIPVTYETVSKDFIDHQGASLLTLVNEEQLEEVLRTFHETGNLDFEGCLVDGVDPKHSQLGVLNAVAHWLNKPFRFYLVEAEQQVHVRPALKKLLNEIWRYPDFRQIQLYRNPDRSHETYEVSQGEIIENVITQVERGMHNRQGMKDVLLTAPTGAGKSLLFQLAGIYLARQYNLLTLVISPLVALMEDQVQNLHPRYPAVASLNGSKTPSEKEAILEKVRNGEIHILYLAPELLLSYHINTFIGDREIGMVVVDEAHTVTTWGRDFRVDYWFLGDHLAQIKRTLRSAGKRPFVTFALTATAVYDASRSYNDMVFETISALRMVSCFKYIGSVRRNNINFKIRKPVIERNYLQERRRLTVDFIIRALEENRKAVVYFPFKSTINIIMEDIRLGKYRNRIATYFSELDKEQKVQNALDFRNNVRTVMCATKAYGMGVDVSDIEVVYHHAPTGSLCDYVQEIGRAARTRGIDGKAEIDFTERDFYFINMLHGLSTIRTSQLRAVIKKLMQLYDIKNRQRNMIISSEDFAYIFPSRSTQTERIRGEQDNQLKSCLMLIRSELYKKFGYEAFYVRPKSMFTQLFLSVLPIEANAFAAEYGAYLKSAGGASNYFILDAEKLWTDRYRAMSFAKFKYDISEGQLLGEAYHVEVINKLTLQLPKPVEDTRNTLSHFLEIAANVLEYIANQNRGVGIDTFREVVKSQLRGMDFDHFFASFKMLFVQKNDFCNLQLDEHGNYQRIKHNRIYTGSEGIHLLNIFDQFITAQEVVRFCSSTSSLVGLAELLNSLDIATYERLGGESPSIFVRINNPSYFRDKVLKGNYTNSILNSIYEKFEYSKRLFAYFFQTEMNNDQRWDFIEDYFLGKPEHELIGNISNN